MQVCVAKQDRAESRTKSKFDMISNLDAFKALDDNHLDVGVDMCNYRRWEKVQISRVMGVLETRLKLRYDCGWINHGFGNDN